MGAAWLATALLVIGSALLLARSVRWWWAVGAVAVVASQTLIVTAWSDARAGSIANALLLLAVVHGYASHGPTSYRREFERRSRAALAAAIKGAVVTESDLAALPGPVAAYVRQSGAVGHGRVSNFHAQISGRIRSGPSGRWMPFHGQQVNTCASDPARLFFIEAAMLGFPLDVLHVFVGRSATMRVKAGSLVRIVDAAGPAMDQSETVTVFNDLCVLAPSALLDASIAWEEIDSRHVRGAFTRGPHTVRAVLAFNDADELIDFVSDDRFAGVVPQRWSTPLRRYRSFGTTRIAADGDGRWQPADPQGAFTYIEFHVDDIAYDVRTLDAEGPHHRQRRHPSS
jgi:hypothetical protein